MSDQQVQKVKIKRLAHVGLWTTDVATQARFYHQVLGLDLRVPAEANADLDLAEASIFLGLGEEHHSLGLYNDNRPSISNGRRPVPRTPLNHITFEVDSAAELAALAARLKISGIDLTLGSNHNDAYLDNTLWLNDPDGNHIEVAVAPEDILDMATPRAHGRRITPRPRSLQHIALYTQHLEAMVEFYTEALGFDISDWLLRERAWLRCNNNHHTILFIQGQPGIDHIGYHITDSAELLRWADYLSTHQVPIVWGPGRHGAGNDLFIRFTDPDGIHIELSTEMQQYYDHDVTTPPRLWHTRTVALNIWGTMPAWIREEVHA